MREYQFDRYSELHLDANERPKKRFVYFVTGSGEFPYDMLRYDCAYPASGEDAHKLGSPYFGENIEKRQSRRTVKLVSHREPTFDRWSSFGWSVGRHGIV